MKNTFKSSIVLLMTFILTFHTIVFAETTEPVVQAESTILVEATTGKIIYQKDSHKKMFPASMTKILTALVTLDHFAPEALITVGTEINEITLDSSKAGHIVGETLTVENLIRGLIIPSGNDSANVLASAVAKKVKNDSNLTYNECQSVFTDLMNEKAKELGAKNTHFTNAHGYHDIEHYTTASDMSFIAIEALKNETIKKIAAEKSFIGNGAGNSLENDNSMKTKDYNWKSHNLLITDGEYYYPEATGLKTGFTDEAGSCVTASAEKDGKQLIAVIFNSPDPNRWLDAKNLFEYGFTNFNFADIQKNGDKIETVGLSNHNRLNGDYLDVIVKDDIKDFLSSEQLGSIKKEITYTESLVAKNKDSEDKTIKLIAPIEKDSQVGTITYKIDDKVAFESKLYAATDVEKNSIISSIKFFFKNTVANLFTVKGIIKLVVAIVIIILIILIIKKIRRRRGRIRYKYKYKKMKRR